MRVRHVQDGRDDQGRIGHAQGEQRALGVELYAEHGPLLLRALLFPHALRALVSQGAQVENHHVLRALLSPHDLRALLFPHDLRARAFHHALVSQGAHHPFQVVQAFHLSLHARVSLVFQDAYHLSQGDHLSQDVQDELHHELLFQGERHEQDGPHVRGVQVSLVFQEHGQKPCGWYRLHHQMSSHCHA